MLQYSYGGANVSGIDAYLSEAYRGIDHSEVVYDLLFRYESPFGPAELHERFPGSNVHELGVPEHGNPVVRQFKELRAIWRFFSRNRYQVIEINMASTFMCIQAALVAKVFGVSARIMHSHGAAFGEPRHKRVLKRAFTPLLVRLGTEYWSCAEEPARYLYGEAVVAQKRWLWVKNPVDTDRFVFDPIARATKREELGLGSELAVCIVGRLSEEKNHLFGIQVFRELRRLRPAARLFIVGGGPLQGRLEAAVAEAGLSAAVEFLGQRRDLDQLYSAFDLLLAPSLREGFPVTALEAQASGLPGLVSPAYPTEARFSPSMQALPLSVPSEEWAVRAVELCNGRRESYAEEIKEAGFTAEAIGEQLEREYRRISEEIASGRVRK